MLLFSAPLRAGLSGLGSDRASMMLSLMLNGDGGWWRITGRVTNRDHVRRSRRRIEGSQVAAVEGFV